MERAVRDSATSGSTHPVSLELLSYSDWEDGEATPHSCGIQSSN